MKLNRLSQNQLMMTTHKVKKVLIGLERKMYGYNYEVHFGIEVVDNCETIDEVCRKLSIKYSDARFYEVNLELNNESYLWKSINYGFAYRGDNVAGLNITDEKEAQLLVEANEYKSFIRQYLTETTEIFSYPDESGVPYVFIFWGYSFILFNPNGKSLFIHSLASD